MKNCQATISDIPLVVAETQQANNTTIISSFMLNVVAVLYTFVSFQPMETYKVYKGKTIYLVGRNLVSKTMYGTLYAGISYRDHCSRMRLTYPSDRNAAMTHSSRIE